MALRVSQVYVTVLAPLNTAQTVSQTLGLTDDAVLVTFYVAAADVIGFQSSSDHNFVFRTVIQELTLTSLVGMDVEEFIVQYLNFTPRQVENVANSVFSWDGESLPRKGDYVNDVYQFDASNEIDFADGVIHVHLANNSLGLSSTVAGAFFLSLYDGFTFTEIVDPSPSDFSRESEQHCIKQGVSFKISGSNCVEKDYSPFIGAAGDDTYDEMPVTPPDIVSAGAITFNHPPTSPTSTITLKTPAFGNIDALQFTLIDRTTRGGERITFGDPNWPKADIRDFTIENVSRDDMLDFVDFINASLGQEIGVLDWEGRAWHGVIIAPESPITETVTGYTLSIRFQGNLQ